MKPHRSLLLVGLLWLGALPAPGQNRRLYPLPDDTVPNSFGVNIHFTDPRPGEMKQLSEAGFRWIRMDFTWAAIEKRKGEYDFQHYDRLLAALAPYRIRPLFILCYGNDLYEKGAPRMPEARAAFVRFVEAGVDHFRNRGIVWEMWNEPNIFFWRPAPNADEYIALTKEVGKAIRKKTPQEWFIGPAVSAVDLAFLEKCFAGGLLDYWDAVSFHPYRSTPPETAATDFARVRALIARSAPPGKTIPILSGEWGYSELYSGLNPEKQGAYLARQYLSNLANGLVFSIWYDWHDDGVDPKNLEHHFGAVYRDYRPKPAYRAARVLTQTLGGFRFNKRLALSGTPDSAQDFCLLFTRGAEVRLAVWTMREEPYSVTIPSSAGRFRTVRYTGEVGSAEADAGGLRLTLTGEPVYLMPERANALLTLAASWTTLPPTLVPRSAGELERALGAATSGAWPQTLKRTEATLRIENVRTEEETGRKPGWVLPVTFRLDPGRRPVRIVDLPDGDERSDTARRLRVTLSLPGMPALSQETAVLARAPLRVTPLPPSGSLAPVRIENPTGEAFTGRLLIESERMVPPQFVQFQPGEREKTLLFLLPTGPASGVIRYILEEYRKTRGAEWTPVLTTPSVRMVPLETFSAYSIGPAPPGTDYLMVPDGDSRVKASLRAGVESPAPGLPGSPERALTIAYRFDPGWKFLRLIPQGERALPLAEEPDGLGMWIHGDGSRDLLRMRFTDATGQTFQPDAGAIDWKGWRYVVFALRAAGTGHWGGANDGRIHYPIHLDSLLLIDTPGRRGGSGALSVTGVTLLYGRTAKSCCESLIQKSV